MTLALTAADRKRLDAIAAKGFRVVVEGNGVRVTVEPVDAKPGDAVDPFDAVTWGKK